MITPQQIHEISFEKVRRGGYDMDAVDSFLEPLTEDYITLYKENSVLKSKMRILVEKLEEYRNQEGSMQSAILAAQKTCEQMILDTEKKCAQMLREAEETAASKVRDAAAVEGEEQERIDAAKAASRSFLDSVEQQLLQQIELLKTLRDREFPPVTEAAKPEPRKAFDFEEHPVAPTTEERADALIEEIGQNLEMKLNPKASSPAVPADLGEPTPAAAPAFTAPAGTPPAPKRFEHLAFGKNYPQDT
ncbi:MAG: DivIVA domain-containing protein [Oscillospiraceae bacterium]|nr:DivIVA domain-containing protein [Oscillospiraceae bacterium]